MKHPQKWRDTCDPFALPYRQFQAVEILGYPHAGNDVFHARGMYRGEVVTAYIKAARQPGAAIENEVAILSQLDLPRAPKVIDHGAGERPFSVTLELPGERLSAIVGENRNMESMTYLAEYGGALAKLHQTRILTGDIAVRRFHRPPDREMLERSGLLYLEDWFAKAPAGGVRCFCHGDFHYANVLWQDGKISGILDFELAGYGNRDFDIAWAMLLRPGQKFLKTAEERQAFLDGYAKHGEYDPNAVQYYMAQCYVHFLQFSSAEREYCAYIREWLCGLI